MKRMSFVLGLAAVAVSTALPAATVSVSSEGDSTFATAPADGTVTQSVTATFSLDDVSDTFFKAKIEFPEAGDSDEPEQEEPEEDPEE